ncbi:hyaluronidase-3 isoform X1 [Sorex araneus]|uniref:hyaluronidase-3 isoform X1 n=1 Tax=Sorex araneus TaxID=42254 RepID=UPI00064A346C|nr:hyaluronidase-3 isoform X1 [Sorex araneus]XP_054991763.1 hyaluronidase-3 isoform X1 [Sorex araneus]
MQLGLVLRLGLCLGCGLSMLQVLERPFIVLWNVPSASCNTQYGVQLPLDSLGIIANHKQNFHGQNITIFYKNQFGLYPYIGPEGKVHHGGIPQAVALDHHLSKASAQIQHRLKPGFFGLAVLDWEQWYPLWDGNWGHRQVYQEASLAWIHKLYPQLDSKELMLKAKTSFEKAAQSLMEITLWLGKALKPQGHWGFYGFPACGNAWNKEDFGYSGECHPQTIDRNSQLQWLWTASTALFPSIYLPAGLPPTHYQAFVRHRLEEAFRVAFIGHTHPLPVFAYSRLTHRDSEKFLTRDDLVQTMGVSAALGAAGVVLWGDMNVSSSQEECWTLSEYLVDTLGPYVINVTSAAMACSHQLCFGHGRCVRREPNQLEAFLHVLPDGSPQAWTSFVCHCYKGWDGPTCQDQGSEPGFKEES